MPSLNKIHCVASRGKQKHVLPQKETILNEGSDWQKVPKHHALAQEHRSEISPPAQDSGEAEEDSRHPEQLSCAPALFLPMR